LEGTGQPGEPGRFSTGPIRVGGPGPPRPVEEEPSRRRDGRRLDLAIGIVLGIVLGVGVVTAFVFLGSEETIDAPRLSGEGPATSELPVVAIGAAGQPVERGIRLGLRAGRPARFVVDAAAPVLVEAPALGFAETVAGREEVLVEARRAGEFPLVVRGTGAVVATLVVEP
jgi:hypothetical protein